MRRLLALLTVPAFVLAACGDSDDDTETSGSDGDVPESCGDDTFADGTEPTEAPEAPEVEQPEPADDDPALDGVSVTGEVGEQPTVEVSEAVQVDGTVRRVVVEGEGEPVEGGVPILHMAPYNGRTGEPLQQTTSYDTLPQPQPLAPDLPPALASGLVGVPEGSRVLVAFPLEDMFPTEADMESAPIEGMEEGDALMFVADIMPTRAMGTEVDPPDGMPAVTLDDSGAPSIEVPEADAPTELISETLIEGDGPEVTESQEVLAQYTGVCWEDGGEFDSTWSSGDGQPSSPQRFPLASGVIEGWAEGIPGHTVGSQILLVIPSEKGYGSEGTASIPPDRTLVFVIDILAAADPLEEMAPPGGEAPPAQAKRR